MMITTRVESKRNDEDENRTSILQIDAAFFVVCRMHGPLFLWYHVGNDRV